MSAPRRSFAVLALFNSTRGSMFFAYHEGDELTPTTLGPLTFEADSAEGAASFAFAALNADDRPNGQTERSLSVGDVVVVIDETSDELTSFACEPFGWREVPRPPQVRFEVEQPSDAVEVVTTSSDDEPFEPLPPARRLRLYLGIARRIRPYRHARGLRHAAVQQAWDARRDLRREGQS